MATGLLLGVIIQQLQLPAEHVINVSLIDGLFDAGGRIFIASLSHYGVAP